MRSHEGSQERPILETSFKPYTYRYHPTGVRASVCVFGRHTYAVCSRANRNHTRLVVWYVLGFLALGPSVIGAGWTPKEEFERNGSEEI